MKELNQLTIDDIMDSDYNTLISVVEETNRLPGGYLTVQAIANACFLDEKKHILEIGTSTGNTAIELARMCHCKIDSIDINERSIIKARQLICDEGLDKYITVTKMDATELFFESGAFDLVLCGNVTSLMPNKEAAFKEYIRVLKHGGILVAVPMYYVSKPSSQLINEVSLAIKIVIKDSNENEWLNFYSHPTMVLKYRQRFVFDYIIDDKLELFINMVLSKPHLKAIKPEVFDCLTKRYRQLIYLFRENLSKMGFSILLYSKESINNEPELFTAQPILNDKML